MALFLALTCDAQVTVTTVTTNGMKEPFAVVVDANNNAYLTDSGNNRILQIDASTDVQTTLAGIPSDPPGSNDGPSYAAHFNNPQGLLVASLGGVAGLLVTDTGNNLLRFVSLSDGTVTTLAGQTNPGPATNAAGLNATFRYPSGLAQDNAGNVYIADWGNSTLRVLNLNDPLLGVTNVVLAGTSLNRPTGLAYAGPGQLWVADTGNETVKLITLTTPTTGTLTTYVGTPAHTGTNDALFGPNALFNAPGGLLWVDQVGLLISDTLNNSIRLATNNPVLGATNYSVVTYAGSPGPANGGLLDGAASSARFNSPQGLAVKLDNDGFLVADLKNNALRCIQNGPPLPPVPAPAIGWVTFQFNSAENQWVSELQTNQPFLLDNAYAIEILQSEPGVQTHFTWGPTPPNPLDDTIPDPSATFGSTSPQYQDGLTSNNVPGSIVAPAPDLTIKAMSFQPGRLNSPVVSARFQFQTATPEVMGRNAANFAVNDQTTGAHIWYTLDGSQPTDGAPSLGPITNGTTLALNAPSNLVFQARAFYPNFQDSDVVSNLFLANDFIPNSLTFGFASGQASSDFVASPGQSFVAPVTLTILPNTVIYSLQFDITITNAGASPGLAVAPNTYWFQSTLTQPDPANPGAYIFIPPYMYLTNSQNYLPPQVPLNQVREYNGAWFEDLEFTNSSLNMLGIGWLERQGQSRLFTTSDLIQYSQPHDTIFSQSQGQVALGEYTFQVPANVPAGQTYQLSLSRPSATSDGIGDPGSEVLIATPTNGAITGTKTLTMGQRRYIAGDSAPFRWFNAGEFGDTNLDNSDVMQVFQSAIYALNTPPQGSDFFDSMDSCGCTYTDPGLGYLLPNAQLNGAGQWNPLFDGDDTTINQIAFGDGVLDVCDVYVTFRRSLDPTLTWFQRFWTNGVRAAQMIGNPPAPPSPKSAGHSLTEARPQVNFSTTDSIASPGQTLQVPISAQVFGAYPLRVLMLGLSVNALDGSPPLTSPVQFTPHPGLGQPTLTSARALGSYAATWLDSTIAGFSGAATLGTLSFQIPTNAPPTAAYAVHFDHASASPNGLASFPKQTLTGLITLSDRSASSYNDGIPDSWRLRYFGTVSNLLSVASADADGDGADNWSEYLAGTDPTDPKSCLRLSDFQMLTAQGTQCVLRWPSVAGKQYLVEASPTLFPANWMPLSTNSGSGSDLMFQDASGASPCFYRVRLAP
jgi:hypothetical protein